MRLIDADKLIRNMHKYDYAVMRDGNTIVWGMSTKDIVEMIKEQPTVEDVAPVVHAEWEHRYDDFGEQIDDKWYCSQCAGCNEYRRTWHCPGCGAKMDGKETE